MQSDNTSKIAHSRRVYYGENLMVSRRYWRRWEMIAQTSVMAFCVFTVSICALFSTDPKNKSIPIISANLVLYTLIHRHKEIDFLGKGGGTEGGRHTLCIKWLQEAKHYIHHKTSCSCKNGNY
jgi:hypothetical protein